MSDKMYLNLMQEQLLCEKIREYHILFDKSQKGYKEKVAVENAWKQVYFIIILFYYAITLFSGEVTFGKKKSVRDIQKAIPEK